MSKLKTLYARLQTQQEELLTCTTIAQVRCVKQAIADTERQLNEECKVAAANVSRLGRSLFAT